MALTKARPSAKKAEVEAVPESGDVLKRLAVEVPEKMFADIKIKAAQEGVKMRDVVIRALSAELYR